MVDTQSNVPEKQNRPILIWIAALYYVVSSLLPFLAVMVNDAARNEFLSQSAFQYLLTFPVLVLNLVGAGLLIALRKYAFYTLSASLVISIFTILYIFGFTNYISQASNLLWIISKIVISWLICVAIIMYARYLMKMGVLK